MISKLRKLIPDRNYPWPLGKAFLSRLDHYARRYYRSRAAWNEIIEPARPSPLGSGDMIDLLRRKIEESWTNLEPDGTSAPKHLAASVHDSTAHYMLCQKTFALALFQLYETSGDRSLLHGALDLTDYALKHRESNGLFRARMPIGLAQDEGPVTAGIIRCLCRAYRHTGDVEYRDRARESLDGSVDHLFHPDTGFFHSLSQRFRCTNVTASFLAAEVDLAEAEERSPDPNLARTCLSIVSRLQTDDGMFRYSDERPGVFRSLYQFLVILALRNCEHALAGDLAEQAADIRSRAEAYADTLIRPDGSVEEPDMGLYCFAQSASRAACATAARGDREQAERMIAFLSRFCSPREFMLEMPHPDTIRYGRRWEPRIANLADILLDLVIVERFK